MEASREGFTEENDCKRGSPARDGDRERWQISEDAPGYLRTDREADEISPQPEHLGFRAAANARATDATNQPRGGSVGEVGAGGTATHLPHVGRQHCIPARDTERLVARAASHSHAQRGRAAPRHHCSPPAAACQPPLQLAAQAQVSVCLAMGYASAWGGSKFRSWPRYKSRGGSASPLAGCHAQQPGIVRRPPHVITVCNF